MHPDAIIAGLKRELDRLDKDADDYKQRKAAIEKEIEATDRLERPVSEADKPEVVFDHQREYLKGLERELERAEKSREKEIKDEIKRVKAELAARGDDPKVDEESAAAEDEPAEESAE